MVWERPLLKVSRHVAACSECSQRKTKCDGALPACGYCQKHGKAAECTSTDEAFARGKDRSYVAQLENARDQLKARLYHLRNARSQRPSSPADPSSPPVVITKAAKTKDARDVDDIVSDFGYLTVNATARDFHGFTAFFSYGRLISAACSKQVSHAPIVDLPATASASLDMKYYLSTIYPLLPFLDETDIHYAFNAVLARNVRTYPMQHWIVLMILAICAASRTRHLGDEQNRLGRSYVATATTTFAEHVLKPGAVTSVQALLLLTQYATYDPEAYDEWQLVGASARMAIDLGLHQDASKARAKLDLRRRVYHSVYALDRLSSITHRRAFAFTDDATRVALPKVAPFVEHNHKGWLRDNRVIHDHVQLRRLQSRAYHDLYLGGLSTPSEVESQLWSMHKRMNPFRSAIVSHVRNPVSTYLEGETTLFGIVILSQSPHVPQPSAQAQAVLREHCMEHADLVTQRLAEPDMIPFTIYDAINVYFVLQHLVDVLGHDLEGTQAGGSEPGKIRSDETSAPQYPQLSADHSAAKSRLCLSQLMRCLSALASQFGRERWVAEIDVQLPAIYARLASMAT